MSPEKHGMCGWACATRIDRRPFRPAHVAECFVAAEIKLGREGLKIPRRNPRHGFHELGQPFRPAVQLFEHRGFAVFGFVLRLTCAEGFRQIAPERIQSVVGHLQEATCVLRAPFVEEERRLRRVAITPGGTVAVSLEEPEGDQSVEEIGIRPWMQAERRLKLGSGHGAAAKAAEQLKFDGRQQRFRGPEGHTDFHDSSWGQRLQSDLSFWPRFDRLIWRIVPGYPLGLASGTVAREPLPDRPSGCSGRQYVDDHRSAGMCIRASIPRPRL